MAVAGPRSDWTSFEPSFSAGPRQVKVVYIHHSAFPSGGGALEVQDEHARMRAIEDFHINVRGFAAVAYSKVVFGSERAFDGRGWGIKQGGNFDGGTNETTYSICFDGDFSTQSPSDAAFATAAALLVEGVEEGFVAPDFQLRRHGKEIVPPGVPNKEHCAGLTVLECTGKDCPGKGVYLHFDRLLEEDPLASLSEEQVTKLLADTAAVANYIRALKEAGSKAITVDAALDRIASIERKVDALTEKVAQLGRARAGTRGDTGSVIPME